MADDNNKQTPAAETTETPKAAPAPAPVPEEKPKVEDKKADAKPVVQEDKPAETPKTDDKPAAETPAAPVAAPVVTSTAADPAPVTPPAPVSAVDTAVVKPTEPAPAVVETPETAAPVAAVVAEPGDDENVQNLSILTSAWLRQAESSQGQRPEDFTRLAMKTLELTSFVIKLPTTGVLDAFLQFISDNLDGQCAETQYYRGVSKLTMGDQQKVMFLYTLFSQLARKQDIRINTGQFLQTFKKPQIGNYYDRKIIAIRAAAAGA